MVIVECIYAHTKTMRKILTKILDEKIRDDYFTEKEAQMFAKKILYDNPIEIYQLKI